MTISHDLIDTSTGLSISRYKQQIAGLGADGGIVVLSTIRIKNNGTETPTGCELTALTARLSADGTPKDGKELVVGKWLEAKPSGGAWTPIGDGDSATIAPLAAYATTDVEMRLNIPAGASVLGTIEPMLAIVAW